jgi:hypothetical protein
MEQADPTSRSGGAESQRMGSIKRTNADVTDDVPAGLAANNQS